MPAQTTQVAPAQQAGQAQPHTTVEAPGGPFSSGMPTPGPRAQYVLTAQAYGATITSPLVAVPGYRRKFRLRFVASGGSGNGDGGDSRRRAVLRGVLHPVKGRLRHAAPHRGRLLRC